MGIVAGVVSLVAFPIYFRSIVKKKSEPSKSGWIIWTLAGALVLPSYWYSGATWTIWVPATFVIGPLVVAVLTWKFSKSGWSRLDTVCVIGAIVGVVVWFKTDNPLYWLLINLAVDFLGAIPTMVNSYKTPEKEDKTFWTLIFLGIVLNFFAIEEFVLEIWIYPVYMTITGGIILGLLLWPRKKRPSPISPQAAD